MDPNPKPVLRWPAAASLTEDDQETLWSRDETASEVRAKKTESIRRRLAASVTERQPGDESAVFIEGQTVYLDGRTWRVFWIRTNRCVFYWSHAVV